MGSGSSRPAASKDLEVQLSAVRAEKSALQTQLTEAQAELKGLRARLESADAEKQGHRAEASSSEKGKGDPQQQLQDTATSAERELSDLRARLKGAEESTAAAEKEKADLEARLKASERSASSAEKDKADLQERLHAAEKSAATAEEDKVGLEARLAAANVEVDRCRETSSAAQTTISDLQRQLEIAERRTVPVAADNVSTLTVETNPVHTAPPAPPAGTLIQETKLEEIRHRCSNKFFKSVWDSVEPQAPMVVLSLTQFKAFGKVPRSDEVEPPEFLTLPAVAKVVFVSHRWLRPNADAALAHPDDEEGSKHALLGKGIEGLAAKKGWAVEHVYLWMDFFSIQQFDAVKKLAGISSLRGYASACDAMIVPCAKTPGSTLRDVDLLPGGYGERAWTRLEAMTFYTVSALSDFGHQEIYAVADGSSLFIEVYKYDLTERYRPSKGELFSEADRPVIEEHESKMMQFLEDCWADPEMCFRLIASNMVKGRKLTADDAPQLLAAVNRGMELGLEIACSELDFRGNAIGDEGAKALAAALRPQKPPGGTWKFNSALATLCLSNNAIGHEGAKALGDALAPRQNPDGGWLTNGALTSLDLGGNDIGDEGAKALGDALAPRQNPGGAWVANEALVALDLFRNAIGDEGAKALGDALAPRQNPDGPWVANGALSTLTLSWNTIGDEGAKALGDALAPRQNPDGTWVANGGMEKLVLINNAIGDEGAKALGDALAPRQNPDGTWVAVGAMEELMLGYNNMSEEGKTFLEREMVKEINAHREGQKVLRLSLY